MRDEDELIRLYGPWVPRTPHDAAHFFQSYHGLWWIAGGWAIEEFTGVARPHVDLDVSIPRSDVALLRQHVEGRRDVWMADHGSLRPFRSADTVPASCDNLWLRESGSAPWEYDVLLMDLSDGWWRFKRNRSIGRRVEAVLLLRQGVRYLRPEVQLLHKAAGLREKDEADFAACLPLPDPTARTWLGAALQTAHPGHPWISRLSEDKASNSSNS